MVDIKAICEEKNCEIEKIEPIQSMFYYFVIFSIVTAQPNLNLSWEWQSN